MPKNATPAAPLVRSPRPCAECAAAPGSRHVALACPVARLVVAWAAFHPVSFR